MLGAFLTSFREVLEAGLIVGLLISLFDKKHNLGALRAIKKGIFHALLISLILFLGLFLVGSKANLFLENYEAAEPLFEGVLMFFTAFFISLTAIYLHHHFSQNKQALLQKINHALDTNHRALYFLTVTAILRESVEIVIFFVGLFLNNKPQALFLGLLGGIVVGVGFVYLLAKAIIRLSTEQVFKIINVFLLLFAAGLLAHGYHEFSELGFFTTDIKLTFSFLPEKTVFIGAIIKSIFGITKEMTVGQLVLYFGYLGGMSFLLKKKRQVTNNK
jgi:high-affinity iron transporter